MRFVLRQWSSSRRRRLDVPYGKSDPSTRGKRPGVYRVAATDVDVDRHQQCRFSSWRARHVPAFDCRYTARASVCPTLVVRHRGTSRQTEGRAHGRTHALQSTTHEAKMKRMQNFRQLVSRLVSFGVVVGKSPRKNSLGRKIGTRSVSVA